MTANEAAVSVVDHALLQHPCARPRGEFIWFDSKVSRHADHISKNLSPYFFPQIVDWEAGVHREGITMKN